MNDILYYNGKIKEYENLMALCEFAGETKTFGEALWSDLLLDPELYQEYLYYMIHGTLLGKLTIEGYSLIDMYVWQMDVSNLIMDTGKNTAECNKTSMVLRAFKGMVELKKDPESFIRKMTEGRGQDKL